jgi:hypothetical protein
MQAQTCVTFSFMIHINFTLSIYRKKKNPASFQDFNEEIFGRTGAAKLQFDYAFSLYIPYTEPMKI